LAELTDTQQNHVVLFAFMDLFDKMALFVFYLEMIMKWLDDFGIFWNDWWNIIDFVVTIGVRC
jgi:cation channel sperm-associated protein 2